MKVDSKPARMGMMGQPASSSYLERSCPCLIKKSPRRTRTRNGNATTPISLNQVLVLNERNEALENLRKTTRTIRVLTKCRDEGVPEMVSKNDVTEELEKLSSTISTQVRTTALGVRALIWSLLVGAPATGRISPSGLVLVGVGAVLTLFFDFLQYFAGYVNNHCLYREMEEKKLSEGHYRKSSLSYRLRTGLFWAKQLVLALSVLGLLAVVVLGLCS
jgi:hypothetical protein